MIEQGTPKIQKGRSVRTLRRALFEPRHYKSLKNILLCSGNPLDFMGRYIFAVGAYPSLQRIKINGRRVNLQVYSWHDVLTINEIFFRNDYVVSGNERTIVDFGSNIGVSATYFLAAAPSAYCYLFEPLPNNILRLNKNLAGYESRYSLQCAAVALRDGEETFGFEDSGRYGGIGIETGSSIVVPCLDSIRVLNEIVDRHGSIDILKIDIESLEKEILGAIPLGLLTRTKKIFVEQSFVSNPLPHTHDYIQTGSVAQFFLRQSTMSSAA